MENVGMFYRKPASTRVGEVGLDGVSHSNGEMRDVTKTGNIDWLLILGQGNLDIQSNINKKEQISGLEALGDIATSGDTGTPMDGDQEDNAPNDQSQSGVDQPNPNNSSDETGETDNADGIAEGDNSDGTSDDSSNDGSEGATDDTSSDDTSDQSVDDPAVDPHLSYNRRVLISEKLLQLYDAIKDSMDKIANGPNFVRKPVKLEALGKLLDSVRLINESVNKVKDVDVILLRYAICVKAFAGIIGK